jgi:hypothetical protein
VLNIIEGRSFPLYVSWFFRGPSWKSKAINPSNVAKIFLGG